jgi:hypothetical protein
VDEVPRGEEPSGMGHFNVQVQRYENVIGDQCMRNRWVTGSNSVKK